MKLPPENPPPKKPTSITFSGVVKKVSLLILAGLVLAALITFLLMGGTLNDFGANLFWAGVAIIAIGAGLDAGEYISQSPIFRIGQTAGKAKVMESMPPRVGEMGRSFPNLFIFILAGILTILLGTLLESLF